MKAWLSSWRMFERVPCYDCGGTCRVSRGVKPHPLRFWIWTRLGV